MPTKRPNKRERTLAEQPPASLSTEQRKHPKRQRDESFAASMGGFHPGDSISFGAQAEAEQKSRPPEQLRLPLLQALYDFRFKGVRLLFVEHPPARIKLSIIPKQVLLSWTGFTTHELSTALNWSSSQGLTSRQDSAVQGLWVNVHETTDKSGHQQRASTMILEKPDDGHVLVRRQRDRFGESWSVYRGEFDGKHLRNAFGNEVLTFGGTVECHVITAEGIRYLESIEAIEWQAQAVCDKLKAILNFKPVDKKKCKAKRGRPKRGGTDGQDPKIKTLRAMFNRRLISNRDRVWKDILQDYDRVYREVNNNRTPDKPTPEALRKRVERYKSKPDADE